ncbi:MAG TPA: hypothetical protein VM677_07865 [Actinokineospora sp.]|nr:hypothetical protein [Actinokineospora sp.]
MTADGYLFQSGNPNLVATAATANGGPITSQVLDPAKVSTQRWSWNPTQPMRVAYGYDQWMPSSAYQAGW